jgi:hypothetical protein
MSDRRREWDARPTNRKELSVSIKTDPVPPSLVDASSESAVEIDVDGRWDALALSEALVPFHSFLVQHTSERWVVHARVPGGGGERLADALRTIEEWQADRGLDTPVRIASRPDGSRR